VAPPRRQPLPFHVDWNAHLYTGGVALAVALCVALGFAVPPDAHALQADRFDRERLAHIVMLAREQPPPVVQPTPGPDAKAGGDGRRHAGPEGKAGKDNAPSVHKRMAVKGPRDNVDLHLAREQAYAQARTTGMLALLHGGSPNPSLASIFGRESALGRDAETAIGDLVSTEIGDSGCDGPRCGLGLVGSGIGGGAKDGAFDTVGLGPLGVLGPGGGGKRPGIGFGPGTELRDRRHVAKAPPEVIAGTARVEQGLDKELVRQVIRRHLEEVRYCYEKELARKPDLYGRVITHFLIAGTGKVMSSAVQSSTMNDPLVDGCIAEAVRRWEFPASPSRSTTIVSYPFVLKRSGAE
jgi:hypothetical protein